MHKFTKKEAFNNAVALENIKDQLIRHSKTMTDENCASFARVMISQIDLMKKIPHGWTEIREAK